MPQWISDLIAVWPLLGAIATALFILSFLWNKWGPGIRTALRVLDRLTGVPADARTGQVEVLGLFEWLKQLNDGQDAMKKILEEQDEVLETIRHEVEFNNGSSVKDAITRTEEEVGKIAGKMDVHLEACSGPSTTTTTTTVTSGAPTP